MTRRVLAALLSALVLAWSALLGAGPAGAAVPGPPQYPQYWWDEWGIPALWSAGADGRAVTVAVIDSGVAPIAPLRHALTAGTDLTGLGGNGQVDREIDVFSHGTAMASIVAATDAPGGMLGVAPRATILPIAVPLVGVESRVRSDRTVAAIDYAVAHGADIISMSFGERRNPDTATVPCPDSTQAAIFRALAKGVLVVAAAGNDGEQGSPVTDPSVCLGVISVAAIDATHQPAPFSSRHRYVSVSAPGVQVLSLNRANDLYVGDGTSQATALVSGALALIWSAHRTESNRQIAARLMAGLRDVAASGRDIETGYGAVNPLASARAAITASSPNPVFAGADPFLRELRAPKATLDQPVAVSTQPPGQAHRDRPPPRTAARTIVAGTIAAGSGLLLVVAALVRRRPATATAGGYPAYPASGAAFWLPSHDRGAPPVPPPADERGPGPAVRPGHPGGPWAGPTPDAPAAPSGAGLTALPGYPESGPIPGAHPLAVSLGLSTPDAPWPPRAEPAPPRPWPSTAPAPAEGSPRPQGSSRPVDGPSPERTEPSASSPGGEPPGSDR
jgi:hypothetical protein